MLLEKSPNVNAVDADGMAPLAHACKEGHEDVAVKLLKAGAYTNVQVGIEERLKSNLKMRLENLELNVRGFLAG